MLRGICILMTCLFAFCGVGCVGGETDKENEGEKVYRGEYYKEELEHADQSNLYGMCYLIMANAEYFDYAKALKALDNMGVKSIRNWMHFGTLLEDPNTLKASGVKLMKDILKEASKYEFQIIGMNHQNYSLDGYFTVGKHKRQPYESSKYYEWLDLYEQSWYTLVSAFPEVTYWEIDNEINNKDFMYIDGEHETLLSTKEMADIATDMLFYASRGIHRANPNAITVMGGIVDTLAVNPEEPDYTLGTGNMIPFLEKVYDNIDSGEFGSYYYDDFFQCAAWHPYYYRSAIDDNFIEKNNAIYEVIKRREGKDKKVFLTEFGWSEQHVTQEQVCTFISNMFEKIKKEMPYVESLHYFRLLNNLQENGQKYGLYYDPKPLSEDKDTNGNLVVGMPKTSAYAYQSAAGGQGELDLNKINL